MSFFVRTLRVEIFQDNTTVLAAIAALSAKIDTLTGGQVEIDAVTAKAKTALDDVNRVIDDSTPEPSKPGE